MTDTLLVLGQAYPTAATTTTLYTVPAATSTTCSTLVICNQSTTAADSVNVAVRVAGAALTNKQYIIYQMPMQPNNTYTATIGMSLATTDVVSCYSTNGTSSFNLFGVQLT
jgi:hypothetical protein